VNSAQRNIADDDINRHRQRRTKTTTKDNETHIRGLYAAVNRKDLKTIADFGAPNSEWLDVPFNFTSTGTAAIIDPWKGPRRRSRHASWGVQLAGRETAADRPDHGGKFLRRLPA